MNSQKKHYVQLHNAYVNHYFDASSMKYRDEFIYRPMFNDIKEKSGPISVLELASSSGENSKEFLNLFPSAAISGCDISPSACAEYREYLKRDCFECDLTVPGSLLEHVGSERYDLLFVVGGVHHCISSLDGFFSNVKSVLKRGGLLVMYEPNSEAWYERLRKVWYLLDKRNFSADSEEALAAGPLFQKYGQNFTQIKLTYLGGPAYFLILNSLVLRVPLKLKKYISAPLMILERMITPFLGKRTGAVFVAVWEFE